ncbi:MAG TPA: hypothetical protein VIT19_04195, partial [Pyrinomonadaceae bacterium]
HHLRADGEEVRAVMPLETALTGQFKVRLVDERGGLQSVAGPLLIHLALSDAAQFGMHQRNQFIERGRIAFAPIS